MADPAELFLGDLANLLSHCKRQVEEGAWRGTFVVSDYESCQRRLEYYVSVLVYMDSELNPLQQDGSPAISAPELHNLLAETRPWLTWLNGQELRNSDTSSPSCSDLTSVAVVQEMDGRHGRPSYCISRNNLEFLRDSGFKWTDIARMFGVSESTITRRVREFGLQSSQTFSNLSDDELLREVEKIHTAHPDAGCRIVRGILLSNEIRVPMQRVNEALRAVNPILAAQRWGALVRRRTYRVKGANSLWHVDSHHSLIRWRLVVHGGKFYVQ